MDVISYPCPTRKMLCLKKAKMKWTTFQRRNFETYFVNENIWTLIKISLKLFVPEGPIDNIPTLIQIMAWPCADKKPLSESMMVSLPTYICVTRPKWVKTGSGGVCYHNALRHVQTGSPILKRPLGLGIGRTVRTSLSALWQQILTTGS